MKTTKIVEGAAWDTEVSHDDGTVTIQQGEHRIDLEEDEAQQMIEALEFILGEMRARKKVPE